MLLFLDNDILLKIGSLGLLGDLEKLFHTGSSSIYILPTAKAYILNNKKLREKYPSQVIKDILTIIENYQTIPDEFIDESHYQTLAKINKIDSGERVLFSINPPDKEFLILTGDKNSIIQLNNQSDIDEIRNALNEKLVCLEYMIIKFVENHSLELIIKRMHENKYGGDKTLQIIFGQSDLTNEKVNSGLMSYYINLQKQSNNLLLSL